MSQPTFKDIEIAARWLDHALGDQANGKLVEELAFLISSNRYMERQRCADIVDGMVIVGRMRTEEQESAADVLRAAASAIRQPPGGVSE